MLLDFLLTIVIFDSMPKRLQAVHSKQAYKALKCRVNEKEEKGTIEAKGSDTKMRNIE